eukprot:CAMPEP_0179025308 /NCGR_PEP_ID=MMETSP0796-20121207/7913_1 /TAXON_ID=73915 /ORGANISM="Pyrodinium bahamense, Strain pbaha01" /LENGTH=535 /DNA_ID=CAMNT_0020721315 /DNA_START=46 /DNA_END=1653 /DNA_ORIENTATION=-
MSGCHAIILTLLALASTQLLLQATATPLSPPVFAPCSGQWQDCTKSQCCSDSKFLCYEKNPQYAQCRSSCLTGVHSDEPRQSQTKWTCRVRNKFQVLDSMATACEAQKSWHRLLEVSGSRKRFGPLNADWLQRQRGSKGHKEKETEAAAVATGASQSPDREPGTGGAVVFIPGRLSEWVDEPESGSQEKEIAQHPVGPLLFCFAVVAPGTYEPEMVAMQYLQGSGIFGCDGYRVVSNLSADVLFGKASLHLPSNIKAHLPFHRIPVSVMDIKVWVKLQRTPAYWDSAANSWRQGDMHLMNAPVFVKAWDKIFSDGEYAKYDWTVKLDVDAFLVPGRLRAILRGYTDPSWSTYVQNVGVDTYGNMLHGPIEVLSKKAVDSYRDGAERCKEEVNMWDKGEDWYLFLCLEHLGVPHVRELRLLNDHYWASVYTPCNTPFATFHPFKDKDTWQRCLREVCPMVLNPWTSQAMAAYKQETPVIASIDVRWRWPALAAVAAVSLASSLVACRRTRRFATAFGGTDQSMASERKPCLDRSTA